MHARATAPAPVAQAPSPSRPELGLFMAKRPRETTGSMKAEGIAQHDRSRSPRLHVRYCGGVTADELRVCMRRISGTARWFPQELPGGVFARLSSTSRTRADVVMPLPGDSRTTVLEQLC